MAADRQVATVSFVFTDLVGSTELRDRVGDDRADELMRSHVAILRDAVESRGGRIVKHLGDGIMAAFPAASDAVSAAIDMQRRVAEQTDDDAVGLRVGVNTGEAIIEDGDYFGTPVVVAKRLCDLAQGGQILTSDVVTEVLGSRGRFSFEKLGATTLKGLSGRFELNDVAWRERAIGPVTGGSDQRHEIPRSVWIGLAVATTALIATLALVAKDPQQRIAPGGPRWERVEAALLPRAEDVRITRVAATDDVIAMTGHSAVEGEPRTGFIWISSDGRTWEEAELPEVDPAEDSPLWGIVAGPRGFVAVGSAGVEGDRRARVFTSSDGRTWQAARDRSGVLDGPGDQVINRVIPGGPGYVAVGYERRADSDGVIWTSSDGITWRRVADPRSVFGGRGDQEIRAISHAPDGGLVAVGLDDSSGDRNAAAWLWDGQTWTRSDPGNALYGDAGEQLMTGVIGDGRRVVAVGQDVNEGARLAAVWVSRDLSDWERLSAADLAVDTQAGIFEGIAHIDGRFYGIGATTEDDLDATVWVSRGGTRWAPFAPSEALTGEGDQTMRDVVLFKGRLVAGGWEVLDDTTRPLVWLGTT